MDKLSSKAQELYKDIMKLVQDDTITKKEELERIKKLVDAAENDVIKEFKDNNILVVGIRDKKPGDKKDDKDDKKDDKDDKKDTDETKPVHRGYPGGYISTIYHKLNRKQKHEIDCILNKRNRLIKKEMKKQINHFVSKLNDDLKVSKIWFCNK